MNENTLQVFNAILATDKSLNAEEKRRIMSAINPAETKRERLLTTKEVCELLGVTRRTLYNWEAMGRVKPIRQSLRSIRYCEREILEFALTGDPQLARGAKCSNH